MPKQKKAVSEDVVEPVKSERPTAYIVAFFVAVLCFAGATWLAASGQLAGWEYTWLQTVNNWPDSWRMAFVVASIAPESLWFGAASVVVAFLLKMYHLAWRLSLTILLGVGVVTAAKHFVGRARPLELADGFIVRTQEVGFGYPSMHAMMITVIVLTLLPYLPRGWRWVVALVPVVAMVLSRLYLGVHAPLDVIGGVALGVALVAGLRILPGKLLGWLRL